MTTPPRGKRSTHWRSSQRARSERRTSRACPTSEAGPSRTSSASAPVRGSAACSAMSWALATGAPRSPLRWVWVTRRHNLPQPTPGSTPAPCPRANTVTRGYRGSTSAPPRAGLAGQCWCDRCWHDQNVGASSLNPSPRNGIGSLGAHRQIHAEHRGDACLVASLHKAHCAVESVAIGQGERGLAQRGGTFHQRRRGRSAVTQRESGRDVQVGKSIMHCHVASLSCRSLSPCHACRPVTVTR